MAATSRVSTAYVEAITTGVSTSRVSTAYVEAITAGASKLTRVSTTYIEVIGAIQPPSGGGATLLMGL